MPNEYGLLSLLPPVIAIILAIRTKQVYVSLLFGIWLGWLILSDFNPLEGSFQTVEALVDVFREPGNTRTIMFCALVGALIIFIQRSGGVEGFIIRVNRLLHYYEQKQSGSNRIIVQLLAWFTGMLIFVESSISVLTVGALYRPVFDKLGISREKLAYVADSSSAPSSILIPFNGWGAFIMSLLVAEGFTDPFATLFRAVGFNFYPILALLLALIIIITQKDYGPMRKAERRVRETGALLNEGATPMISDELTDVETASGIKPKAYNMVLPIVIMVLMMPAMLATTGWEAALANRPEGSFGQQFFYAIGQGSGSTSVLIAVITSTLFAMCFYRAQGLMKWKEMIDLTLKGISGMMPLALLMMFAFAIGAVCKELGTGQYVADVAKAWLSPSMVPFIVFLVSCFIAFSTGTSWGTFAIMISIAVPMAKGMGADVHMTIAAALGGGVFGDHCSPISDTTILSSMASATDHIDHVRTQLPYALTAGGLTALLYLAVGLLG
ncbi:Na+/H+ antiporter NhaC family protein [Phaeodactylibacter luteus]|uniref:Sodium:solute symporter n=1 Tax=Phaeodactylibacter luteus TaxID=1564516 RepID=A0A5C6RPV9_9BACT|nr:Na+/H+ antiporter NhaC family protein [Phaeodactylibacter luteus]TXB64177.1 sodium:solute symporter [Phaeodactylibacter luteus]